MADYPNLEQKLTYADFKQLCTTYCNGQTSYDTSKGVSRCWASNLFGSKMLGYRFKCQCVGSRESMRLEGCGVPPYYDAAKGVSKVVVDKWPKGVELKSTSYDDFTNICKTFCNDHDDYYVNKSSLKSIKLTLNSSKFSVLSHKRSPGHLFNCTCKRNKEERLSVSEGL